jgi:hypothetical protein
MFKFTIRELVLVTIIAALVAAWWHDHRQLARRARETDSFRALSEALTELLQHRTRAAPIEINVNGRNVVTRTSNTTPSSPISVRLAYEGTMLVLVTEEGAAAVTFRAVGDGSAYYDYRFESRDGTRTYSGTKPLSERKNGNGRYADEQSIRAGPISMEWSQGGPEHGCIYYFPEKMKVYPAKAEDFADQPGRRVGGRVAARGRPRLDLKRFLQ